jgi:hypothetical protein
LSCDFEDPFVCGYTTSTVNEVSWERIDRNRLNHSEIDDDGEVDLVSLAIVQFFLFSVGFGFLPVTLG